MIISVIRTILLYAFIILAVRLMGKRQIGDLQTSELVITLLISDIASIPMQDTSLPLIGGFLPISILVSCEIIVSIIMLKHSKFRNVMCGKPVIVIREGKILQPALKHLRMSIEDLFEQLRQKDVFNLKDIQYCIVETNGKISVLNQPESRVPTAQESNIQIDDTGIEAVIISDGEFLDHSLALCQKNQDWALRILKENNINNKHDVYLMTANKSGEYNLIKKDKIKN